MNKKIFHLIAALLCLLQLNVAEAYIGPGAGVSAIGTALAFVVIVLLLIVGFLWYPVKTFMLNKKDSQAEKNDNQENKGADSDEATGL